MQMAPASSVPEPAFPLALLPACPPHSHPASPPCTYTYTSLPPRSLRDFGMGRSSILEGGVGLFLLVGSGLALALVVWAKGVAMRKAKPYQAVFEFPLASGISVGTPVRIRGVQVSGRGMWERVKVDD